MHIQLLPSDQAKYEENIGGQGDNLNNFCQPSRVFTLGIRMKDQGSRIRINRRHISEDKGSRIDDKDQEGKTDLGVDHGDGHPIVLS